MIFRSRIHQVFFLLVAAAAGSLVMAMAWPRFVAGLNYLPVERASETYFKARKLPDSGVPELMLRAQHSQEIFDHYRFLAGLGLLSYAEAIAGAGTLSEQRTRFEQATEWDVAALERAPLQPDVWLRLAAAGNSLFWRPERVLPAYKAAIYAGRVEPTHLVARIELGYRLLGQLDDEAHRLLRDQTLLAWNLQRNEFNRSLKQRRLQLERITALMAETHPDMLAELEAAGAPHSR